MRKLVMLFVLSAVGCAHADKGMLWTEEGLRAADGEWDAAYRGRLEHCESLHDPMTAGAEDCFGEWYDADGEVETAVRSAVGLLRAYWTARAAGQRPDWGAVAAQVAAIVADLPEEARAYFERVRGL